MRLRLLRRCLPIAARSAAPATAGRNCTPHAALSRRDRTRAAAVSPSLKNLLLSVLAGGSVLGAIAVGIIAVSSFDKVTRKG